MTSTTEQSWALPVDIASLGAHLAAYVALRPTIETLRLCNRFGPADTGISKLPTELVEHVEQYLIEDERAQELKVWTADKKCNEGQCKELDHLDNHSFHKLYHDMQAAGDLEWSAEDRLCVAGELHRKLHRIYPMIPGWLTNGVCGTCAALGSNEPYPEDHVAHQHVKVQDRLEHLTKATLIRTHARLLRYSAHWVEKCQHSRAQWNVRMGRHNLLGLGGKMSEVLRKDFGLQIRVVHGPWRSGWEDSLIRRPVSAYLQLSVEPSAKGLADMPAFKSGRIAQFGGAVKSLGLEVVPGADEMHDSGVDSGKKSSDENDQDAVDATESISAQQPRLATFSKYVGDWPGELIWASEYHSNQDVRDVQDSFRTLDDDDWMWAVVKTQRPKTEEPSTELLM